MGETLSSKREAPAAVAEKSAKLTLLPAEEVHAVRRNVEESAGTPFADAMRSPLLALARVMATLPTIAHAQTHERPEASLPVPQEPVRGTSNDPLSGDAFGDDDSFSRYVVSYGSGHPSSFQRASSDESFLVTMFFSCLSATS
jgi:hypothetical protein